MRVLRRKHAEVAAMTTNPRGMNRRPSKISYSQPDNVTEPTKCLRILFLAHLARWLFPTTPTVRIRVNLYDAPKEYVDAYIRQEES